MERIQPEFYLSHFSHQSAQYKTQKRDASRHLYVELSTGLHKSVVLLAKIPEAVCQTVLDSGSRVFPLPVVFKSSEVKAQARMWPCNEEYLYMAIYYENGEH